MTTVASGRCTSPPTPTLTAIGMKPTAATSAVISTGRKRTRQPSRTACSSGVAGFELLLDERHQHQAVENGHAAQGDEADGRAHGERHAAQPQRQHAAHRAQRNARRHDEHVAQRTSG